MYRTPGPRLLFVTRALLSALVLLGLAACAQESEPELEFLLEAEEGEGPVDSSRVQELRREIDEYQADVRELSRQYSQIATFQKLLANELMSQGMYGPALDALRTALDLQPDNPVLNYLAGLALARLGDVAIEAEERERRLLQAEGRYRAAIELRGDYNEALYALAILLAFELERPDEALPFARRLATLETGDPAPRFLLANVLVRIGRVDEAIEIYADLSRTAPSQSQRDRAAENMQRLSGGSS